MSDSGIGMTPEEQGRIFDRFSQASHKTFRDYGGSGLGLSISKHLVKLMGGDIHVESQKGKGSVFTFTVICDHVTQQDKEKFVQEEDGNTRLTKRKGMSVSIRIIYIHSCTHFDFDFNLDCYSIPSVY